MSSMLNKSAGVMAGIMFLIGALQGLGLGGVGQEPVVQGVIGGMVPVVFGFLAGILLTLRLTE